MVLLPKGNPGAPLSDQELANKFRGNCAAMLASDQVKRLREPILRLPEAELTRLLAPVPSRMWWEMEEA